MQSEEVLKKTGELSIESISSIAFSLELIGIDELLEAQVFPGRVGQTVEVKDSSGQLYYVGLSSYGFVQIIRKGSRTGEIVYVPIDD